MKIVISGAGGFVGSALAPFLERRGFRVATLVRRVPDDRSNEHRWDPETGDLDPAVLSGAHAVINLNGHNISEGRWTDVVKEELRSSRLAATRTIVRAIGRADARPPLLINASATGFYGDRGGEILDENSSEGAGFLAELAADWEAAAGEARSDGVRVVPLRLGMVLGDGSALKKMLLPFRLGLGGPMGNGRQYWPWIAMADVTGAVDHIIDRYEIDGPVNLVAPEMVTSREFARTLGAHLGRPAVLPTPAFAVKTAMGEMAEALLLSSTRAVPKVLEDTGYRFKEPTLAGAFRRILR